MQEFKFHLYYKNLMTKRLFICYVNVVLVSLCGRFVAVLVCGRFGLWLCLWPFWMYAPSSTAFSSKCEQCHDVC